MQGARELFGLVAIGYCLIKGEPWVLFSQRRTKKDGRWTGTHQFGWSGGVTRLSSLGVQGKKREMVRLLLDEMQDELPLRKEQVSSVTYLGGALSHLAPPSEGTSQNTPSIHGHVLAVRLKQNELPSFLRFEKFEAALTHSASAPSASVSNELSMPVLIPLSEARRMALEKPEKIMPGYHAALGLLESHLRAKEPRKLLSLRRH